MTFVEAEIRFRELQESLQKGASMSRAEFERKVAELAVVDEKGLIWEIHPHQGQWMYYDGATWVAATPPGYERSPYALPQTPPEAPETQPKPQPAERSQAAAASTTKQDAKEGNTATFAGVAPMGRSAGRAESLQSIPVRHNLAWLPAAIGAAILVVCAFGFFFGGRLVLGLLISSPPTPTSIAAAVPTNAVQTPSTPATVVGLPTIPPPTSTVAPVTAVVIEQRVNVRAGPSTSAEIVGKISKDDIITLVGRSQDSTWYHALVPGTDQPHWVFAETLNVSNGDAASLPVVQP